jgi:hypothetical protein
MAKGDLPEAAPLPNLMARVRLDSGQEILAMTAEPLRRTHPCDGRRAEGADGTH